MERMEAKASQITKGQRRPSPAGETEDRETKELRAVRKFVFKKIFFSITQGYVFSVPLEREDARERTMD